MVENNRFFSKAILYWIYLIGFFLIILQEINLFPPWFTPIDWGKAIIFRTITAILLFIFTLEILFKKRGISSLKDKIRSVLPSFLLLISLFLLFALATFFSLDPSFSLWGNPQRNGGFVNFGFYIVFGILAFFTIDRSGWKKILNFSIFIGIITCIIAIFQQFGFFSYYLIPYESRPVSSMGNAILFSIYLILLTFISFALGLKTKKKYEKLFYIFSSLLFFSVNVFLAQTRGSIIGLAMGSILFFFSYFWQNKKIVACGAIILALAISSMFFLKIYLDSHLEVYKRLPPIVEDFTDRTLSIFEGAKVSGSRISAWKIALQGLKERPILGWGPENFKIAFDKYYDPSLPFVGPDEVGSPQVEWWDRAHNLFFDISIAAGIPAFLIYLSVFIALIWELQKTKKRSPEIILILNSLQATFVAYFVALMFGFDSVSTYLMFFLLIGYSFHLINESKISGNQTPLIPERFTDKRSYFRISASIALFSVLLFFIYFYNLKPLILNKEMNEATAYSDSKLYPKSLEIMNKIYPHVKNSIIDNYLSQKSVLIIYASVKSQTNDNEALANQAIAILNETTSAHPNYVQNWLLLAEFYNLLMEQKNKSAGFKFYPTAEMLKLKDEANFYFEKASLLSPKRQVLLNNWADTDIITEEYEGAEKKLSKCLSYNPNYTPCIWKMALAEGYSGNAENFNYFYDLVEQKGGDTKSENALRQLADMYIYIENYDELSKIYIKLIEITGDNKQKANLHASLAATYVKLKQYANAKKEAQKIFELIPYFPLADQAQVKSETESFIKSLGL